MAWQNIAKAANGSSNFRDEFMPIGVELYA
jgi:hypothetical protein